MREVGGQRKNASRVRLIAAAAVALVIYGVLFYIVFYDKLRGAGAFSSMVADYRNLNTFLAKHGGKSLPYAVYFLGGLALAAILYMTVVTALRKSKLIPVRESHDSGNKRMNTAIVAFVSALAVATMILELLIFAKIL